MTPGPGWQRALLSRSPVLCREHRSTSLRAVPHLSPQAERWHGRRRADLAVPNLGRHQPLWPDTWHRIWGSKAAPPRSVPWACLLTAASAPSAGLGARAGAIPASHRAGVPSAHCFVWHPITQDIPRPTAAHSPQHPASHSVPDPRASHIPQHPTAVANPAAHPAGPAPGLGGPRAAPYVGRGGVRVGGVSRLLPVPQRLAGARGQRHESHLAPQPRSDVRALPSSRSPLPEGRGPGAGGTSPAGLLPACPPPPPPPPHWAPGLRSLIYLSARVPVLSLKARLQNGRLLTP